MKWLLLSLLGSLFLLQSGYAQERTEHLSLIETLIRNKQDTARIYYADSVLTIYQYRELETRLREKSFNRQLKQSLELSDRDVEEILSQVKKSIGQVWDTALFSNSQRIPDTQKFDYLATFVRERFKLNQTKYKYVWSFSKPIAILEDTVVLVFTQYLCHSQCGENEWAFYKKEGDTWKRWLSITGAAF